MPRLLPIVTMLLVAALCVPAAAGATEVSTFTYSGRSADAWSSTQSESIEEGFEDWFLFGGATTSIQTGDLRPQRMRETIGAFNHSSFVPTMGAEPATFVSYSVIAPTTLAVNRSLSAASVDFVGQGEISVWRTEMPWDGGEETIVEPDETRVVGVTVSGDWTGAGTLWKDSYLHRSRTDGFFMIDRYNSTYRNAVCDALVVDSEGTVWFDGRFDTAQISDSKSGGHMKGMWPEF